MSLLWLTIPALAQDTRQHQDSQDLAVAAEKAAAVAASGLFSLSGGVPGADRGHDDRGAARRWPSRQRWDEFAKLISSPRLPSGLR